MNPVIEKINAAVASAAEKVAAAAAAADIEAVRIEFLGRNGLFPALSREMGSIPAEEKRETGAAFNKGRQQIQQLIDDGNAKFAAASGDTDAIDTSLPGRRRPVGRKHPIMEIADECVEIFGRMGFVPVSGPEMEDIYHNFDALNTPADHPSRDEQDTFYINNDILLRTQTSPVQVRVMEEGKLPIRMIAPGRVFRSDEVDATHSPSFHQIEGLVIDKNVTFADLKGTLAEFAKELFGEDTKVKFRPHHFPFTEPSAEVDVTCFKCGGNGCRFCKGSGWIEILGCGMVHPRVLKMSGIDPEEYSGFAFGVGLERIALLKYEIDDMRLLYENDERFLKQF